ncbi:hypothetical protein CMO92_03950 [Candidatus Woesearchaeota archaeon]|nr:hypothetical protein [Candidatus Woesearchaeota archaeon]|tara:strand:- start:559 stop:891 length:333 start_codon:yes stop_codon:yes gene_type:complete
MAKKSGNLIGSWAFLIGVILAVILGAVGAISANWSWSLVVLGIIVGLLNIQSHEAHEFMVSGAILVLVSSLGASVLAVEALSNILTAILTLFVPATIIVALKSVFALARS